MVGLPCSRAAALLAVAHSGVVKSWQLILLAVGAAQLCMGVAVVSPWFFRCVLVWVQGPAPYLSLDQMREPIPRRDWDVDSLKWSAPHC